MKVTIKNQERKISATIEIITLFNVGTKYNKQGIFIGTKQIAVVDDELLTKEHSKICGVEIDNDKFKSCSNCGDSVLNIVNEQGQQITLMAEKRFVKLYGSRLVFP